MTDNTNKYFKLKEVDHTQTYETQTDCQRHVVGVYANIARHNMTLAVNTVMQSLGEPLFEENSIADAFNDTHRKDIRDFENIKKLELQERLYRHFPFLKRMYKDKEVSLKDLMETMSCFTQSMAMVRNTYTHYRPFESNVEEQNDLKTKLGQYMEDLFLESRKVFKKEERLDASSNEVLGRVYKSIKNDKGEKYVLDFNYPAYMKQGKEGLSDVGLLYFLCLFLDKKAAFDLLNRTGFTQHAKNYFDGNEEQTLLLLEMMCMNRIRMVHSRIDSEMSNEALALDMLNELRKCPRPLYEQLGKDDRDSFKDVMSTQWENESPDNEDAPIDAEGKSIPKTTMVRWDDRFATMALSYIDTMQWMDDIRFQLKLGKYRFAFYNHDGDHIAGNLLRVLQKEMHGFGRIREVEKEMNEKWGALFEQKYEENGLERKDADQADQAPYITRQRPQYAIDDESHSIGMRWDFTRPKYWDFTKPSYGDLANKKMFIPHLPGNPKPAEEGKHQTNQAERLIPPQCTMSLYELPALLFYEYLRRKLRNETMDSAEQIIKRYCNSLKSFFGDVSRGKVFPDDENELAEALNKDYGLRLSDIPERLKNVLLGNSFDGNEKLKKIVKTFVEERKNEIKEMKRCLDEGINHKLVKTGQAAQWLARDIMIWVPTQTREKLSGQKYSAIQANLAMVGNWEGAVSYGDLRQLFTAAGIIPESNLKNPNQHHPFLKDVLNGLLNDREHSVKSLYQRYLDVESSHISSLELKLARNKNCLDSFPSLHHNRMRWKQQDAAALAQSYLTVKNKAKDSEIILNSEKPIQLPKGMFAERILAMMKELAKNNGALNEGLEKIEKQEKGLKGNTAYLIGLYHTFAENDASQPYYNYERVVDEGKLAKSERKRMEQTIRRYKTQDILLFYMAREILALPVGNDNRQRFLLKNAMNNDLLSLPIDFSWTVRLKDGSAKTITQKAMKMKDYGNFHKFASDGKRLASLLEQQAETEFARADIEAELARYEQSRVEVFRQVYILESHAVMKLGVADDCDIKAREDLFYDSAKGKRCKLNSFNQLMQALGIGEKDRESLTKIRNAFAHNYYVDLKGIGFWGSVPKIPNVASKTKEWMVRKCNDLYGPRFGG